MKWMGGWSVHDYEDAPADLTEEIVSMMWAEHERYEEMRRGQKGSSRDFNEPRPAAKPLPTQIDPKTGREVVTKTKEDGAVVTHRKVEDGEAILWSLTGKRPKSFQGKV